MYMHTEKGAHPEVKVLLQRGSGCLHWQRVHFVGADAGGGDRGAELLEEAIARRGHEEVRPNSEKASDDKSGMACNVCTQI